MKHKALFTLLSRKVKEGRILFVDSLSFSLPKTKDAKETLSKWSSVSGFSELATKKRNTLCIYLPEKDENVERSFANFGNISVREQRAMNPVDLARYKYIVIVNPETALSFLEGKMKVKEEMPAVKTPVAKS